MGASRLGRHKLRWEPVKERFLDDRDADRLLFAPIRKLWSLDPEI